MKTCLYVFCFSLIFSCCKSKELNDFPRSGLPAYQFLTEGFSYGDCSITYLSYWDGNKISRIDSLEGDSYFHFLTEAEKIKANMPSSYIKAVRTSFKNLKRTIVIDSTDNFYSVKIQDNGSEKAEPFVEIKRFYKNTKD